jgi:hypothetical protein
MKENKYYPDDWAQETWDVDEMRFYLVNHELGHWCGYVRFTERFLLEDGYDGIVSEVPVHGGITYAEQDDRGMVYGFDCAHYGDDEDPRVRDLAWLRAECEWMGRAILVAKDFEIDYLKANGYEERSKVAEAFEERLEEKNT